MEDIPLLPQEQGDHLAAETSSPREPDAERRAASARSNVYSPDWPGSGARRIQGEEDEFAYFDEDGSLFHLGSSLVGHNGGAGEADSWIKHLPCDDSVESVRSGAEVSNCNDRRVDLPHANCKPHDGCIQYALFPHTTRCVVPEVGLSNQSAGAVTHRESLCVFYTHHTLKHIKSVKVDVSCLSSRLPGERTLSYVLCALGLTMSSYQVSRQSVLTD